MLVIRLRRMGSKKRPFFRIVVTDSRTARDSSFVEVLGHYNPASNPETLKIDRARLEHWVKAGAVPSDTVRTLVDRAPEPEAAATTPAAVPPALSADLSAEASAKADARSATVEGAEADSPAS